MICRHSNPTRTRVQKKMPLLALSLMGVLAHAADVPLYVFDNGVGRGVLPIAEQVELARRMGYEGLLYSGTKQIPEMVEAHRTRGMKVLGIYTGINISDAKPAYDAGLPDAIRQLKGTGALITFTVSGAAADGDEKAVPLIREVAAMAAGSGLKVALYPHYGMHVARIEDALRVRDKVARPNAGIVFNLCHWLRSGDEPNFDLRLRQALPHTLLVSVNGADHEGDWDRLIQNLGQGTFDVKAFVRAWKAAGYTGPFGLQCYKITGSREENLKRSMAAWRLFY